MRSDLVRGPARAHAADAQVVRRQVSASQGV